MSAVPYTRRTIPVTGGALTVGVWGERGLLVVAAHGITATHQTWALVGPELGRDHRFVAPDLRGRGGSRGLGPPYVVVTHAADLAAVVAAEGGGPAILVGHSMGGFVVARAARDHPHLVRRAVLVDGGVPFPLPEGVPADAAPAELEKAVAAVVGPAFDRLSATFASRDEYRDFWRSHPAFRRGSPALAAYADYDLVGEPPRLIPSCRPEAAQRDAVDLYTPDAAGTGPLPVPAVFLRAPRGTLDQPDAPLYPPGWVAGRIGIDESTVDDTNHYTITLGEAGAAAVVAAVRGADLT